MRFSAVLWSGPMSTGAESERDRGKRHYQRILFDGIADRYEVSRPGYPAHVVEFVTATAGLGSGFRLGRSQVRGEIRVGRANL